MKSLYLSSIIFLLSFSLTSQIQNWATNDLDVTTFRNGVPILYAQTDAEWEKASEDGIPAYCYYENNKSKGVLYNWYVISSTNNIAPLGWKVPSKVDFEELISLNISLKSTSGGWKTRVSQTNSIFNIKSNGYRSYDGFGFYEMGDNTYYWSSTKSPKSGFSWAFVLTDLNTNLYPIENDRSNGYSLRCIRNTDEDLLSIAPINILGKTSVCKGETVELTQKGGALAKNTKWVWYKNSIDPANLVGSGESISIIVTNDTKYIVRAESLKGLYSESRSLDIKTFTAPSSPLGISVNGTEILTENFSFCEGSSVTFRALGTLEEGSKWQWVIDNKSVSIVSNEAVLTKKLSTTSYIKLSVNNEGCGTSASISKLIKIRPLTVLPNYINDYSVSFRKAKLSFDTGSLGYESEWKWYRLSKKDGSLKLIGKGESVIIPTLKSRSYVLRSEGGECVENISGVTHIHNRSVREINGWAKKYSKSRGLVHFGFDLGSDCNFISDSIRFMDSTYRFSSQSYGITTGLHFHPIMTEVFSFGLRGNYSFNLGTMYQKNALQPLFEQPVSSYSSTYFLTKSTVGGEMLIGFLKNGNAKFLVDYELSNFLTIKSFGDSSFISANTKKKETLGVGFRIGSYARNGFKRGIQYDLIYLLSDYSNNNLFDFSQSMFASNSVRSFKSGLKVRFWLHNILRVEIGAVFPMQNQTQKVDLNISKANLNFGITWSLDRFY